MSLWDALFLGGVQGATEFLPVSSSGHLVIVEALLGLSLPGMVFEVVVHVGTLISVLLVYRARVAWLVAGAVRGERVAWAYVGLIALATVPAAVAGLVWRRAIEGLFESPVAPGVALLVTGGLLWSTRGILRGKGGPGEGVSVDASGTPSREGASGIGLGALSGGTGAVRVASAPGPGVALLMGLAQAFALIPGISRSGTTVVVGLWLGVDAGEAAAFSFLMAVPAILGAAALQVPGASAEISAGVGGPLVLGFVVAAGVGVLAIRTFVAVLARRSFHRFAIWCWVVGAGFLLYLGLR